MPAADQPRSDEELARETQAGALEAFEELVYRYERRVYAFVAQSCRDAAGAREVTQNTFVKAFQAIRQFDSRREFASWLFGIARRSCVDHHRAARRLPTEPVPELADPDDPSQVLARQEDRREIWDLARRCLTPAQFEVLWLRYVEDMSVVRVAAVVGKTATHVKVLLFRARQNLARQLPTLEQRGAQPMVARQQTSATGPPPRIAALSLAPSPDRIDLLLPTRNEPL